jgi:cytochrome c oxidase assembly factor CtaG
VEWSRGRVAAFAAGIALVLAATLGPLHDLSFELLLAHLAQNVILAEWAPALLVFGLPPALGERLARYVPWWAALPAWLAGYFAWHIPPVYDAALRHPDSLLQLEHLTYLLTGCALWLPVAHGALSSGAKAGYVFAAFVLVSPLGLLLALLPSPAYDYYHGAHGLHALEDQQLAGITMATEEALFFFAVLAYYFTRVVHEQE